MSTADVTLTATEAGDGDPVILVHGFPELGYSWRHQVPALADAGLRAIAYDQRGYGGSDKPEGLEDYRLALLVGDLFGLADALDVETFHVVGHDWGSIVAWTAAATRPDRLRSIVSLNVPYRGWCCGFPTVDYIAEHLADRFHYVLGFQEPGRAEERFARDPAAWLQKWYRGAARDPGFQSEDEFRTYLDAFVAGGVVGPVSYYRNIDRNVADYSHLAQALIHVPALMVTTDSDPVLPAGLADGMDRWLTDLRVASIENCGHWTQQEKPEEVNRLLIDFLTEPTP